MTFPRRPVLLALAFLSIPGLLSAATAPASDDKLNWLTPAQEQTLLASVPAYPATDDTDLAGVLKAQNERTPQQVAQVQAEARASLAIFQVVLGPGFTEQNDPKIFALLKSALHDASVTDRAAKTKWNRLRPFRGHPDVVHPVYPETGLSYPSGHATFAYASAVLLAQIFPVKKDALFSEAAQIAEDRVIGGVHYPSDVMEGQQLGREVAATLLTIPAFEKSLDDAKAEAARN